MTVIQEISVSPASVTSPKGFLNTIKSRLFMGSRFAVGLIIFMIGFGIVIMLAKRGGVPVDAVENLVK